MRKQLLIFGISILGFTTVMAQNVGINSDGSSPDASAGLDVKFTDKGLLIPRVALTATNAAGPISSPTTSLLVYNTATAGSGSTTVTPGYYYWTGTIWARLFDATSGRPWVLEGNAAATTDFIGTTNAIDFRMYTNNTERMTIESNGNVGIGTTAPSSGLHIVKSSSTEPTLTVEHNSNNGTDVAFRVLSQGTTRALIHPNGSGYFLNNIGIGTTAPGTKLDVVGVGRFGLSTNGNVSLGNDGNAYMEMRESDGSGTPYIDFSNDAASDYDARIRLSGDNYLTIEGTNVGIGTASPTSLLSVGASSQLQVGTDGDLDRIKNVPYSWPSANAEGTLLNDGSGNLSWAGASWEKVVDVSINSTSYTASGLNGNDDVAYRIVLMGQQVSSSSEVAYISINGDISTANYSYGIDAYWAYFGGYGDSYDSYNIGGILLWATWGGYDPNYVESETILSAFTGNRRHGVTRYSLGASSNNIAVNLSAGVWNNSTTNITSLVFHWTTTFTGRLIIYALH